MSSKFGVKFATQIQFWVASKTILTSKLRCKPDYFEHCTSIHNQLLEAVLPFLERTFLRHDQNNMFSKYWLYRNNYSHQIFSYIFLIPDHIISKFGRARPKFNDINKAFYAWLYNMFREHLQVSQVFGDNAVQHISSENLNSISADSKLSPSKNSKKI